MWPADVILRWWQASRRPAVAAVLASGLQGHQLAGEVVGEAVRGRKRRVGGMGR